MNFNQSINQLIKNTLCGK